MDTEKMKPKLLAVCVLIAVGVLLFFKLNLVRGEESAGMLLWNDSEAYLLVSSADSGFRISLLGYALEPLREYFYVTPRPTDRVGVFTIVRITPAGIERNVPNDHLALLNITPLPEGIYAESPQGLCKLIGMDFHLVSKEEEQKMGGERRLTRGDFSNVNGWSRRRFSGTPEREPGQPWAFSANLKDGTKLTVSGGNPVDIDLTREGRPPERIFYQKQGVRRVSSTEYKRIFRQP